MAVFRVHKTKDFTVMSNHHLRDKNLTLKAKGLLSVILSLPDDWKYSIAGLAAICKEGTSAVKSALDLMPDGCSPDVYGDIVRSAAAVVCHNGKAEE